MKQFLIFALFCLSYSQAKDYTSYKVYDVTANKEQIDSLMQWESEEGIDFWSRGGIGLSSKIMVSPQSVNSFLRFLETNEIKHELFIDDVEPTLQREKAVRTQARTKRSALADENEPNFEVYWTFEEMEAFSIRLAQQYPNLVTRDVIGQSIEGRNIFGLRVSSGAVFGRKPIIFIDSGVHAREWVGHHSTLYLLHQLVTNASVTNELVDKVDWVIVPNANPDGYVYSYNSDRLWRKNRRVVNTTCTGIDLNRNFGYAWQYLANSCNTLVYPGPTSLSEPETFALTTYMESFRYNLKLYLATHSYGNYVLWPFGFAFNTYVSNWREHVEVGQKWVDAIYGETGTFYRLGNSADLLYTANGASDDHAVAFANAYLAFTLELTGGGPNGFDFPQDRVASLARETFLGYRALGLHIGEHFYYE